MRIRTSPRLRAPPARSHQSAPARGSIALRYAPASESDRLEIPLSAARLESRALESIGDIFRRLAMLRRAGVAALHRVAGQERHVRPPPCCRLLSQTPTVRLQATANNPNVIKAPLLWLPLQPRGESPRAPGRPARARQTLTARRWPGFRLGAWTITVTRPGLVVSLPFITWRLPTTETAPAADPPGWRA